MQVLKRYLAHEVYYATLLIFVAFLALFAFFDLISELGDLNRGDYRLQHILLFVALSLPAHIYELFPVAVLIGTLYALSSLAAHSEYTVMRVSGLSTRLAAVTLMRIGIIFVLLTFLVGEFIAPPAERAAQQLRLRALNTALSSDFRSGVWVKDELSFINVREVLPNSELRGVKIYEFDPQYRLRSISHAEHAAYVPPDLWLLTKVVRTGFSETGATVERLDEAAWRSNLNPNILAVLLVVPERMSTWNLWSYIKHLADNHQQTERYEIAFWKKLLYPFASLVMMALALPFAYVQTRAGGISVKLFSGVMLGVLFHMLNSLFAHLGLIQSWTPFFSAVLPSTLFLTMAILMLWWVEHR